MRFVAAVLLLALPCAADERADAELTPDEAARVRWLVEQFRAGDPARRQTAGEYLQEYGERIEPFLQTLSDSDPEVVRILREMTRGARRLKLVVVAPDGPHPLGRPFRLVLRLVNDSDDTFLLPLTGGADPGSASAFSLARLDGAAFDNGGSIPLRASQVEAPANANETPAQFLANGPAIVLVPGAQARFTVTLEGEDVPFHRPGTTELVAVYGCGFVHRWTGTVAPAGPGAQTGLTIVSENPVEIRATGRKAAELEAMLASGDPARVADAVAEVKVREDDEVLPVLRRRSNEPGLRLAAVRRLGAAGREEDFALVYDCTKDPEHEIRRAAVAALAHYPRRKARSRLIGLTQDPELKLDAIRALRSHRHASTVDCFVRLLVLQHEEPAVAKEMIDALYEWTDKVVEYRTSELKSYERWWMANRDEWIRSDRPPR